MNMKLVPSDTTTYRASFEQYQCSFGAQKL